MDLTETVLNMHCFFDNVFDKLTLKNPMKMFGNSSENDGIYRTYAIKQLKGLFIIILKLFPYQYTIMQQQLFSVVFL